MAILKKLCHIQYLQSHPVSLYHLVGKKNPENITIIIVNKKPTFLSIYFLEKRWS